MDFFAHDISHLSPQTINDHLTIYLAPAPYKLSELFFALVFCLASFFQRSY